MTNTNPDIYGPTTGRSYSDAVLHLRAWSEGGALGGFAPGIDRLALLRVLRDTLEDEMAGEVAAARVAGETWGAIGDVLGLTRQGAQQRYAG